MSEIWELASKSVGEIQAEVQRLLPQGWTFDIEDQETLYNVSLSDESGNVVWAEPVSPDRRIALLSVYGWLSTRSESRSVVWQNRSSMESRTKPPFWVADEDSVDVADLDPDGIASVYKLSEEIE